MATVKVQRVKGRNPVTKEEFYYVRTKSMGVMSTEDLVDNIVREGQIPRIYAQGVLDYLTTAIFDYMKAGLSVQIPGLGTMKLNVTSKAQTDEKEANARSITGSRLRLYPFEKTRQEMKNFRFELIGDTVESNGEEDDDEIPVGGGTNKPGGSTGGNTGDNTGDNTGNNTGGSNTGGSGVVPERKYTITWYNEDAEVIESRELAPGAAIVPPTPPSGYRWPDNMPTVMPEHDVRVNPVEI